MNKEAVSIITDICTTQDRGFLLPKESIYRLARYLPRPLISKDFNCQPRAIALVIPYHPLDEIGGLEIATLNFAHQMRIAGIEAKIISRGHYLKKDFSGVHYSTDNVPVLGFGSGIKDILLPLLRMAMRKEFDVVQWMEIFPPIPEDPDVYNVNAEMQYLGSVLLRALGIKTFMYVATSSNVTNRGVNNPNWRKKHQPLTSLLKAGMSGLIMCNKDIFDEYYQAKVCLGEDRMTYVPFGVNTDEFKPLGSPQEKQNLRNKYNLPLDKLIFFYTGRFVKRKRPDLLLEQWLNIPLLEREKAHLVFIGGAAGKNHPDSIFPLMGNLLRTSASQNISVFDLVDRDQMAELVRAGDVFVFPSQREGMSLAVLEAMSSAKPVICFNIGGTKEQVTSESGTLLNIEDTRNLSVVIRSYINKPQIIEKQGQNGRRLVENQFSWRVLTNRLINFYQTFQST